MGIEHFYMILVGFLFLLAIFDLVVGVSNDAVNFLNSAIGSKAAKIKVIFFVAAIGVFIGASFSNGMMEIARSGIYQPQNFYFKEILFILLATMLTDVILLDLFNTLGMPTSTTVSLVFELLGATFAIATIKMASDPSLSYEVLLNTDKALQVILGIFLSIAIAFFIGYLIQYITRLIVTFDFKKNMKYFAAIFGGLAITAILYFMLLKGLKDTSFMNADIKNTIKQESGRILLFTFICSTVIMQILHLLRVNILRVIVLTGTFSLALAFAGNDLVNFIGVPLAGLSAFQDFMAHGGDETLKMVSLTEPAQTPWHFLLIAGAIMVASLVTSKKAKNVVKTSVSLSRQGEGEEMFSSSKLARNIVRGTRRMSGFVLRMTPEVVKRTLSKRFSNEGVELEKDAAFDLIRASINLIVASLLIALGTSLKLPLSTTYVTFMVAMGTSLADKAWGRESAVYRVSGVINVVGGWFLTAIAAFIITAVVATIIFYGEAIAILALIVISGFILIRSNLSFKKKKEKEASNEKLDAVLTADDPDKALILLREYGKQNAIDTLEYVSERYDQVIEALCIEDERTLSNLSGKIDSHKDDVKKMKRMGTLAIRKLSQVDAFERGLYFYQMNDFIGELIYDVARISVACEDHIGNNFNPLDDIQKEELKKTKAAVLKTLRDSIAIIETGDYESNKEYYSNKKLINDEFYQIKRRQLKRLKSQEGSTKVTMLYLSIMQDTHDILTYTTNLLKVTRKLTKNS